ncbi:SdpI family protein [Robiginitalea sp. SC105]|uniref:SdpI family protein n=1 Tax=Robiginitalea sp. SC105 TaxID=2762332 RepID=UPI001639CAE7|nr:SdpI family protein [Robiginitalea sp. SC105]MBC2837941.1 SdpI family protein [Robiginitalea sp. SC105]
MKTSLKTELPLLLIVAVPFVYLALQWNQLPQEVPMHWNARGEIDRWGSKSELWLIPFLTTVLVYLIFLVVPAIDPKNKIEEMGVKYTQLKYIVTACMAALAVVIIHMSGTSGEVSPAPLLAVIGLLFILLGNYFKTVRPNYFIGLRTPWTLESPEIWDKTHRLGGVVWFVGGLLMVIAAAFLSGQALISVFIGISAVVITVPLVYSYLLYRKQKQT